MLRVAWRRATALSRFDRSLVLARRNSSNVASLVRRQCGACEEFKDRDKFSETQLTRYDGVARCWTCYDNKKAVKNNSPSIVRCGAANVEFTDEDLENPLAESDHRIIVKGKFKDGPRQDEHCVAKWLKSGRANITQFADSSLNAIVKAQRMIANFNIFELIEQPIKVCYPDVYQFLPGTKWEGNIVLVEPYLEHFEKFNSNTGWVNGDEAWSPVLQSLCHYTYEAKGGSLILCDLAGGFDEDTIILSEPALMSRKVEFGDSDLGSRGISTFFSTHKCNDICRDFPWRVPADRSAHYEPQQRTRRRSDPGRKKAGSRPTDMVESFIKDDDVKLERLEVEKKEKKRAKLKDQEKKRMKRMKKKGVKLDEFGFAPGRSRDESRSIAAAYGFNDIEYSDDEEDSAVNSEGDLDADDYDDQEDYEAAVRSLRPPGDSDEEHDFDEFDDEQDMEEYESEEEEEKKKGKKRKKKEGGKLGDYGDLDADDFDDEDEFDAALRPPRDSDQEDEFDYKDMDGYDSEDEFADDDDDGKGVETDLDQFLKENPGFLDEEGKIREDVYGHADSDMSDDDDSIPDDESIWSDDVDPFGKSPGGFAQTDYGLSDIDSDSEDDTGYSDRGKARR